MKISDPHISKILIAIYLAAIVFCGICIAAWLFGGYTAEYGICGIIGLVGLTKIYRREGWFSFIDRNTPDTP